MTFLQQGGGSWFKFVRLVLFLVLSPRVKVGDGGEKMVLIAVEAVTAGCKIPTADYSIRTTISGRCSFGALVLLLTRVSPMHFSGAFKRGSAIMSKLVKLVGP